MTRRSKIGIGIAVAILLFALIFSYAILYTTKSPIITPPVTQTTTITEFVERTSYSLTTATITQTITSTETIITLAKTTGIPLPVEIRNRVEPAVNVSWKGYVDIDVEKLAKRYNTTNVISFPYQSGSQQNLRIMKVILKEVEFKMMRNATDIVSVYTRLVGEFQSDKGNLTANPLTIYVSGFNDQTISGRITLSGIAKTTIHGVLIETSFLDVTYRLDKDDTALLALLLYFVGGEIAEKKVQ